MDGVAFFDLIGDLIEASRATIHVHGAFDILFRITVAHFQPAFTDEPTAVTVIHIVDGDGLDLHRLFIQVLGMRGTECLAHGMPCRGVNGLFNGKELVVELACSFIAPTHQSVDSLWRETEHAKATDVGDDMHSAHFAVFLSF